MLFHNSRLSIVLKNIPLLGKTQNFAFIRVFFCDWIDSNLLFCHLYRKCTFLEYLAYFRPPRTCPAPNKSRRIRSNGCGRIPLLFKTSLPSNPLFHLAHLVHMERHNASRQLYEGVLRDLNGKNKLNFALLKKKGISSSKRKQSRRHFLPQDVFNAHKLRERKYFCTFSRWRLGGNTSGGNARNNFFLHQVYSTICVPL